MTNLVDLALAVAIGMTGAFQSGLESLQKEEHAKAAAFFTEVIEAEVPAEPLYWPALYYRAEANAAGGDREAALKDAGTLLISDAPELIKSKAQALYLSQKGDLKALRPKTGPKAFMEKTLAALIKDEQGEARNNISGPLSEVLKVMEVMSEAHGMRRRGGFLSEIVRESAGVVFSDEQFNDTNRTATVLMSMHRESVGLRIGLENRKGEWSATELKEMIRRRVELHAIDQMPQAAPAAPVPTVRKEDVDEALASEIAGLIKDLGNGQASVRAAARRRLAEVKDSARPFLAERVDDPDPEVQMTIRELLK